MPIHLVGLPFVKQDFVLALLVLIPVTNLFGYLFEYQLPKVICNENQYVNTAGKTEVFYFFTMISSSQMDKHKLETTDHDNLGHGVKFLLVCSLNVNSILSV